MLKGFAVLFPAGVIIFFIYWLIISIEVVLKSIFLLLLPNRYYVPGMGILAGFIICYGVGLALNSRQAQKVFNQWEKGIKKIPLIKTMYGALQDILNLFSSEKTKKYDRVVMVTLKESRLTLVGFVTRGDSNILKSQDQVDRVAVYFPMSYQIGGYFVMVPTDLIEPVDMSLEDASRLVFTAAMSVGEKSPTETKPESSI